MARVTRLRKTYAYQTGSGKGWPDVCYEFFVDRDGIVWEGRKGALAGPVVADATGGSQGFAQLVCLIGNFTNILPTPAQQTGLVRTLAWLADRYKIDTDAGRNHIVRVAWLQPVQEGRASRRQDDQRPSRHVQNGLPGQQVLPGRARPNAGPGDGRTPPNAGSQQLRLPVSAIGSSTGLDAAARRSVTEFLRSPRFPRPGLSTRLTS